MKKSILFIVMSFLSFWTSFAQTSDLVPYRKGNLWGYADRDKKIVITPQYSKVTLFTEKITPITADTLSSIFIDATGKQVGGKYNGTAEFSEGLCQVEKNKLQGYLDAQGNEAISLKFNETKPFIEGLAVVREDVLWGVIDKTGKYVINPIYDAVSDHFQDGFLYVQQKGRNFLVDSKGKEFKLPDNLKLLDTFNEGLAAVELTISKNNPQFIELTSSKADSVKVHAFIDNNGKFVLGPFDDIYKVVSAFKNGFCILQSEKDLFQYVSKEGKLSLSYSGARPFAEGHALAEKGGSYYCIIDPSFNETKIVGMWFSDAGIFSDGMLAVQQKYGTLFGFLNIKGEKVIDFKYNKAGSFNNGIAIVELNGKRGCIDKKGTEFWEDK